ncbi:DUF3810 domain-containing protein [Bergeyella sp. RCAD1439]|uniref:DUF3810 domain-containing protein n=1 Tax=Bergeyella anatis TaxID=3113737 RepID=UPI002E19D724|nr:DUF3810 domain-containing protein [Bergeyella sp. RCAD1439]
MVKTRTFTKKRRFWAGLLLAQFVFFWGLSKSEGAVRLFGKWFEWQRSVHQPLFASVDLSVGDGLYIGAVLFFVYHFWGLFRSCRRQRSGVRLLQGAVIFYFFYQLFWGLLYFQRPISSVLSDEKVSLEQTKRLALIYLEKCQRSRMQVQEDGAGVFVVRDISALKHHLFSDQRLLPVPFRCERLASSIKPSMFGSLMSYTGILGYYNPFTAEAQYNASLPSSFIPMTMAHETAHQMGYAREQEANFIGFLIGRNSRNPELRYSAEFFALKSLLRTIQAEDAFFVEQCLKAFSEGMQRDRLNEKEFMVRHSGPADAFFSFANHWFLKSNRQEGLVTYDYFTDLLLRYEIYGFAAADNP